MREEKKKLGWTAAGLLGAVFAPMGLLFLLTGALLWAFGVGEDPEDPFIFLCTFGGMGAIFLLIGAGLLWHDVKRRRAARRAIDEGRYVMAQIVGTQTRTNVNTGRTHPRVVECRYADPDTGIIHVCFSRYLYFDPTGLFTAREVPVYIDRESGEPVFVDIDAVLPPMKIHS